MTQSPSSPRQDAQESAPAVATQALLYDYRQAANPIRAGLTEPIPYRSWDPVLHAEGPSGIIPLDLSQELNVAGPATSPGLAAHFVRIRAGEGVKAAAEATSSLFFVLSGDGQCQHQTLGSAAAVTFEWRSGDLFVLPAGEAPLIQAHSASVLYWVNDAPLLQYLGAKPSTARFDITLYPGTWLKQELSRLAAEPGSERSNRLSLLLGNRELLQTRTVTHVLWAMYGMVPAGATQAPHRHQSVALDLIIDCPEGCYTLVGTELNSDGSIRNPKRIDWNAGGAFITPPGHWHAHVNEGKRCAYLLPIQDAGLKTYLRSLDIRFASAD